MRNLELRLKHITETSNKVLSSLSELKHPSKPITSKALEKQKENISYICQGLLADIETYTKECHHPQNSKKSWPLAHYKLPEENTEYFCKALEIQKKIQEELKKI